MRSHHSSTLNGGNNNHHHHRNHYVVHATASTRIQALRDLFIALLLYPKRSLPTFVLVLISIQSFWYLYDRIITSQIYHKPPKFFPKPTESSPVAPYYNEEYVGYSRIFPIWSSTSSSSSYPCGPLAPQSQLTSKGRIKEGLLYIEAHKSVTPSYLSGIAARIALNMAKRLYPQNFTSSMTIEKEEEKEEGRTIPMITPTVPRVPDNDVSFTNNNSTISLPKSDSNNNHHDDEYLPPTCTGRLVHVRGKRWSQRNRKLTFLYSIIREPVSRIIQDFFEFVISFENDQSQQQEQQEGMEGKDGLYISIGQEQQQIMNEKQKLLLQRRFLKYIQDNDMTEYAFYFRLLSVRSFTNPLRTDLYPTYVEELLNSYDFLGLEERLDESLIVLQLLLGLEIQDLLYIIPPHTSNPYQKTYASTPLITSPAIRNIKEPLVNKDKKNNNVNNNNNNVNNNNNNNGRCIKMVQPVVTNEMKEWFYSNEFDTWFEPDVLVYQAINKSLDRTIDSLGRDRVEYGVKQLQYAKQLVQEMCGGDGGDNHNVSNGGNYNNYNEGQDNGKKKDDDVNLDVHVDMIKFPCSKDGTVQVPNDCMTSDLACGYKCLDKVAQHLSSSNKQQQQEEE